jgi:uncharacterized protein YbaR (Trm112 family)
VPLDSFLLSVIVDPIDHGPLTYVEVDSILYNPRRHVIYVVRDSIPVLLPGEARDASAEEIERYGALA